MSEFREIIYILTILEKFARIDGAIFGSNLDGISDDNESNVFGCIDTNYRSFIRAYNLNNSIIANNYMGVSPNGTNIMNKAFGSNYTLDIQNTDNLRVENNIINSYNSTDLGSIYIRNGNINLQIVDNAVLGGTVGLSGATTGALIKGNIFEGYTDKAIVLTDDSDGITLEENTFERSSSVGKVIHLGAFIADDLLSTPNDPNDTDIGVNELMN
ncbi:MAG: hypothetical protein Q9M76_06710 [Candidatus Dojkabacteria bacterium]|nr:hypothetical protein [Candidatus Dojkabacteria bacterium]